MSKTPLAASLAFASLLGLSILAGPAAADEPLAAPYQLDIGRISVTALSDGQIPVPLADIMRGEPRPEIVSKARPQSSHTNLPCSLVVGGPLAPPRKRAEHAEQSVLAPLGPGPW